MSASSLRSSIGFVGLGNMGRPMASNLCRKGSSLLVFDINAGDNIYRAAVGEVAQGSQQIGARRHGNMPPVERLGGSYAPV